MLILFKIATITLIVTLLFGLGIKVHEEAEQKPAPDWAKAVGGLLIIIILLCYALASIIAIWNY